jgi:hypothetical protein
MYLCAAVVSAPRSVALDGDDDDDEQRDRGRRRGGGADDAHAEALRRIEERNDPALLEEIVLAELVVYREVRWEAAATGGGCDERGDQGLFVLLRHDS